MLYWLNGSYVEEKNAFVAINDIGLLRGYGIFDFFEFLDRTPLFFGDYLDRFRHSAGLMKMDLPVELAELRQNILELIERNGEPNGFIRLLLTGGISPNGFLPVSPSMAILQYPWKAYRSGLPEAGLKLLTDKYQRDVPEAKTTDYYHVIRMQDQLKAEGANDVLYHNGQLVSESSRSNFFLFTRSGTLVTPGRKILEGVTRKHLLKVARQFFPVEVRDLPLAELPAAKEPFISSTMKGVLPVGQIDAYNYGPADAFEYCKTLSRAFEEYVQDHLSKAKN